MLPVTDRRYIRVVASRRGRVWGAILLAIVVSVLVAAGVLKLSSASACADLGGISLLSVAYNELAAYGNDLYTQAQVEAIYEFMKGIACLSIAFLLATLIIYGWRLSNLAERVACHIEGLEQKAQAPDRPDTSTPGEGDASEAE